MNNVNILNIGSETPVSPWASNKLNFINAGSEFLINGVGVCNNSTSCECNNIPLTTTPGEGKGLVFSGQDMQGVNWSHRELGNIRLKSSNLDRANLMNTDLGFALLAHSSLNNAILVNANLAGANLQEATLRGANLEGVTLFDGELSSALPVSFSRTWKSVTIDTTPLVDGTYIDQLNVEMCADGETYVTFLLLEGNGANVENADFTDAKNLSEENIDYICRWGGEYTRSTLGTKCDAIPPQTNNQFAAVITDTFLAEPKLVSPEKNQIVKNIDPELVIEFTDRVILRSDAIELRALGKQASIGTSWVNKIQDGKSYYFQPLNPLEIGITYEVILLPGKALDHKANLLREEIVLGSFKVR
ncbi:MAG: pentapeptide repeat-containing protein [Xenococcus sp. (in: cyanobacteria)]